MALHRQGKPLMPRNRLKITTFVFAASTIAGVSAQKLLRTGYVNDPVGRNVVHIESRAPLETMSIFTNKITGEIHGDPQNFLDNPQARFEVDMNSLDSGIALRNEHLRSNMWLDTAKYPKAVFTLSKLYEPGTKYNELVVNGLPPLQLPFSRSKVTSLESGKTYTSVAQGTMEMHGVTKTIYANIEWTPRKGSEETKNRLPGDLMHVRATFPLRLSDFNINVPTMAQMEVANVQDVTVDFFASTEPTKAPEARPADAPKPNVQTLSNATLSPVLNVAALRPLSTLSELPAADELSQVKLQPFPSDKSYNMLDEKQFVALWRTAKPVAADDKLLHDWQYAPWYSGSFQTPKGRYSFGLYLGGLGSLSTPDGKRGMFQMKTYQPAE